MTKHTPGPWYVGAMNDALFIINEPPRPAPTDNINPHLTTKVVATPGEPHNEGWSREEYTANARLISAAPELLEAAKAVARSTDYTTEDEADERPLMLALMAAIARAEAK